MVLDVATINSVAIDGLSTYPTHPSLTHTDVENPPTLSNGEASGDAKVVHMSESLDASPGNGDIAHNAAAPPTKVVDGQTYKWCAAAPPRNLSNCAAQVHNVPYMAAPQGKHSRVQAVLNRF